MKKFIAALIFIILFVQPAMAWTEYYEDKTTQQLFKGISYESSKRVTAEGLVDVHVLRVDLTQQHLAVKTISSNKEHGLKEPVSEFVKATGAVAGINGDFFGVTGDYSSPVGLEIEDGRITNASEALNSEALKYATFFTTKNGVSFMDYLTIDLKFLNDGNESLNLYAYNRVSDALLPFYIDGNIYTSTKELDARFDSLYKIVVKNDVISYISKAGETVAVPAFGEGFVIVMNSSTAGYNLSKYAVGQKAQVSISPSVNLDNITNAISGGGKIISNGNYVEDGYIVKGNHPRTAIGLNQSGSELIMIVVDGRSHSIGATHGEMADLFFEYGAYNAMHLDGGGSSDMVTRDLGITTVKNAPSDGKERNVINGLGVFNNSQVSETEAIYIETDQWSFFDLPRKIKVYATDAYLNKTDVTDASEISWDAVDGGVNIKASHNGLETSVNVTKRTLAVINTNIDIIAAGVNQETGIQLTGISPDGFSKALDINDVTVETNPVGLAVVNNGKIVGAQAGSGYLKFSAGNAVKYIRLVIGDDAVVVEPFEPQKSKISYLSHPEGNPGHTVYSADIADVGMSSLELAYKMSAETGTQAAYAVFDQPLLLPGSPISLRLSVYGDSSNNWLRAKIVDADGTSYSIDFARYVNWTGFKTVEAKIPSTVKYPISVERIYIAAIDNNYAEVRKIYIDNLTAAYPISTDNSTIPASTSLNDYKKADLSGQSDAPFVDITFIGTLQSKEGSKSNSYAQTQNNNMTEFNSNASYGLFVGATDNIKSNMPVFKWTSSYDFYNLSDVSFINLVATNGNLYSSNAVQWGRLPNDLNKATKNLVIMMDKNPLTALPKKELELMQKLLIESGKNIIVISSDGYTSKATVQDGIRYVNLGSLFNADGSLNEGFKTLRVRFFENDFRYSLK